jgi:ABC-type uncharacterized transport system fused permease/ATPase subunit
MRIAGRVLAMSTSNDTISDRKRLWSRFWQTASGFWLGRSAWVAWLLACSLLVLILVQLMVQYRLNYWNRDFFNALQRRDAAALQFEALVLVPLAASSIGLAILSVWLRMTAQRRWREWLTLHLIEYWLERDHYRRLSGVVGEHQNPEYRIAEDARVATDAPIDLVSGLFSSLLSAVVFIEILWSVGGDFTSTFFGFPIWIPGYLVVAVIIYSTLVTAAMMLVGEPLTDVIQRKNQAEAELIAAASLVRDLGMQADHTGNGPEEARGLWTALRNVLTQWRDLCWQLMRMTLVSHGNFLLAPIIALFLCAPKFLTDAMTLGELTQAAAAFTTVQTAFNWLVDNYQRVADWQSSANRVAALLLGIDRLEHTKPLAQPAGEPVPAGELKQIP